MRTEFKWSIFNPDGGVPTAHHDVMWGFGADGKASSPQRYWPVDMSGQGDYGQAPLHKGRYRADEKHRLRGGIGRRAALKMRCPHGRAGSTPAEATRGCSSGSLAA